MTAELSAPSQRQDGTGETGIGTRQRLMALVDERLGEFLADERARWTDVNHVSVPLIDAVATLVVAGGKRIRPAFCLTGYLAAGGDPAAPEVVDAAVALELLHTCALIHDDVMDESALRRGTPTTHTVHTALHADSGWQGDARRYGENVAILAGDLALVYSDHFMAGLSAEAARLWADLRTELLLGQYMDVRAAAQYTLDPELSRWIAVAKSGHYTVHRPLLMGAALASRPELSRFFEEFGVALGQAFQLRDDLIDMFGDATVTGKPAGLDFDQHKMTLLVALAAQRDPRVREFASGAGTDADQLRELLVETGVRAQTEQIIDDLVGAGCRAIAEAPIAGVWQDELAVMARQVAYRDK
jgi:geranylgeranyl diphosphate synthase type I